MKFVGTSSPFFVGSFTSKNKLYVNGSTIPLHHAYSVGSILYIIAISAICCMPIQNANKGVGVIESERFTDIGNSFVGHSHDSDGALSAWELLQHEQDKDTLGASKMMMPKIRYSKILANFEYKSTMRVFGEQYTIAVGFAGTMNGRMCMSVSKQQQTTAAHGAGMMMEEKLLADFGGVTEDFEGGTQEGHEVRSKEDAEFVLELNDYLQQYVHKTVMEMTEKAMHEKKPNEKPQLDEQFTKELANKMLDELGQSRFGHVFKGLDQGGDNEKASNPAAVYQADKASPSSSGSLVQKVFAVFKDRLTPFQPGPTTIRLSMVQNIRIGEQLLTRMNIALNMEMLPSGPRSCFEILSQTKELHEHGQTVNVHLKATERGPPKICVIRSSDANGNSNGSDDVNSTAMAMGPLGIANFIFRNFHGALTHGAVEQARKIVVTTATPTAAVLLAAKLTEKVVIPAAQHLVVAIMAGGAGLVGK